MASKEQIEWLSDMGNSDLARSLIESGLCYDSNPEIERLIIRAAGPAGDNTKLLAALVAAQSSRLGRNEERIRFSA